MNREKNSRPLTFFEVKKETTFNGGFVKDGRYDDDDDDDDGRYMAFLLYNTI